MTEKRKPDIYLDEDAKLDRVKSAFCDECIAIVSEILPIIDYVLDNADITEEAREAYLNAKKVWENAIGE